ncbi:MAG: 4-hydroxy-tetrahydrodipicolinate synthase [Parvularculaceae bacterium]|jgi:4-hydroxy-tetrahydrodipicolinate synthase|nr:4-hydroxy-tetrahydrodipicolinate synthase [Parvularculaceae bacterium]
MLKFEGSLTALVTPFRNGAVDEKAFAGLVDRQVLAGTAGLVAAGSTGESPTLSEDDHEQVVRLCVEAARGRVPVIAGAGSNDTAKAITLARRAERVGANALLAATGYYNKPSQVGLFAHFKALHDATSLPIILYNVPGRTIANLSVETIAALSKLPRIVALKDATGDLSRVALQRLASGESFTLLSGEDMTAVGFNAMGGRGCISVASNVAPELCARLQAATIRGDYAAALAMQDRLTPLIEVLFRDVNPGPVKYGLSLMGLCTEELRLPLVPPPQAVKEEIRRALTALGLISA